MAKIQKNRGRGGFVFVKELGGAPKHETVSRTACVLVELELVTGRVLDFGCGHGFDADHFGWDAYDPYYRQREPDGFYDTIVCNHVANILTRASRARMFSEIDRLLADSGRAYVSVSRGIPKGGKHGPRRRIQNHVELTLPFVYADDDMQIYRMDKGARFDDRTSEFEATLR